MKKAITDVVLLNMVARLRLLCSGATRNKGGSKGLISTRVDEVRQYESATKALEKPSIRIQSGQGV
jgi:hypothetical protein